MHNTFQINFYLKGFTSILIGAYFFIAGYLIKTILVGFLIDDNPMGTLSPEIIEALIIALVLLVFLFSSLALFFGGKRSAKKFQHKLWNRETKVASRKYILYIIVIFTLLMLVLSAGLIDHLTPIFLFLYAVLLFLFKNKERKNLLILSGLSLLLAVMCMLIPAYWYSSLSILGIAHIAYGVVIK
ncbi:hypothetical protein SAMN04487762_2375 [Polaribacter sp. Hel1_33_78]|uniref:hypothetical protein n=1 Tax=Polaribacter sp. Hel1_33_78 TaxID=1336804 RepID=UPI00087A941B|nr:hypothetical protein [Polaribacter sp. Hel1_33_78]SDU19555.1 hypothetical protein SAMN04487762_2375 [Polaribacter sp. Hel1_33_78]